MVNSSNISIVAFSGELDKLLAVFVIATGAAASGYEVNIFTTFWGTAAMKKDSPTKVAKGFLERIFGWLLPKGTKRLKLSKLNMAGMGPIAMKYLMQKKNVASLDEMIRVAEELGVKINVCEMSMNLMGIDRSEIREYDGIRFCGVAGFLNDAQDGQILFI